MRCPPLCEKRHYAHEKIFEIEIINELSASVYNRVLNYVLNHELDTKNTRLLEVNLLNQLEVAQEVDLFQQPFEELQAIHEYWRSMNQYSKQIVEMSPSLKGVI